MSDSESVQDTSSDADENSGETEEQADDAPAEAADDSDSEDSEDAQDAEDSNGDTDESDAGPEDLEEIEKVEAERQERLDPENRPENVEVDNSEREFDAEKGMYTDTEGYDEAEKKFPPMGEQGA